MTDARRPMAEISPAPRRAPAASVGRSFARVLALLSAPALLIGVGAALLAQQQITDTAALDARALPQLIAAQRLAGDINALSGYAMQFQNIATLSERTTLQERIDSRNASIDRHLAALRRLNIGEATPTVQRLLAARDELMAGVADLAAATGETVRSGEGLRAQLARLRGEAAQPAATPAQAGLRELAAQAASAPSQLILRNIARQFETTAEQAPDDETTRRLKALFFGDDGLAALKGAQLNAQQQQRFIIRRQGDVTEQMSALSSALATEAENALAALRRSAVAGAERLRWLLLAGVALMAGVAIVSARHLHRRVIVRLAALTRMVDAARPDQPPGSGDELDRLVLGLRDMQAQIAGQEQRLRRLGESDPGTGLLNRKFFIALAADALPRVKNDNATVSLLMIDIDHLRTINERDGHAGGDRAIHRLAELLRHRCLDQQIPARLDGDAFAVLMPDATLSEAEAFARRLRQAVADDRPALGETIPPPATVSIGVTQLAAEDGGLDDALRRADDALRRAKADGRNRIAITPPPFIARIPPRLDIG